MTSSDETAYIISDEQTEEPSWTACLIVLQGADAGNRILLSKNEITIGRSRSNDVCFDQEGVSRAHATIRKLNEWQFLLTDNNSTNGTLLNSKEIKETVLDDQDLITIGTTLLKFVASNSPEQAYYDELYRQTHLDKALQIYNKQYFLTKFDEEVARCRRYGTELSLVLFDVDHFKNLNDSYGHLAGDAALVQLATIMKQRIRDTDVLCRYGGEEFAIIMPHVNAQQAYILAEHARGLVAKTSVDYADTAIAMTISLGIASYTANAAQPSTSELLIAQADAALYQAKHAGRNKVVIFNPAS